MAEENKDAPFLGGFDILSDALHGTPDTTKERVDVDPADVRGVDDGDDTNKDLRKEKDIPGVKTVDPDFFKAAPDKDDKDDGDDGDDGNAGNDGGDGTGDDGNTGGDDGNVGGDAGDDNDDSLDNPEEFEESITTFFKEKLSDDLGWDFSEMEEEPKSIEDLVGFMRDLVKENSVPSYASEEVKQYDEFVRNGGDLKGFFKETVEGRVDTESINLEEEVDQKRIIRQNMRNQGVSDKLIERRLNRFEEAGMLDEEAEDALELVKAYDEKARKTLLETQQKQAEDLAEQQQLFINNVEDSISKLSDIKGIKISEKDKKELRDYILVPDSDGLTPYQREYQADLNNLLESAYFTKNKDALIERAKNQGASNSLRDLQNRLNQNKGNRGKGSGSQNNKSLGIGDLGNRLGVTR